MFLNEAVKEEDARKWANEIGAVFGLVSAKTGDCINLLFENVARKYFSPNYVAKINKEKKIKNNLKLITLTNNNNNEKKGRNSCC